MNGCAKTLLSGVLFVVGYLSLCANEAVPLLVLDDVEDHKQTLKVWPDGRVVANTITEHGERVHRDELSPQRISLLVRFTRTSGILDSQVQPHTVDADQSRLTITLCLPGQKQVSVIQRGPHNAPQFDKVHQRLSALVESAVKKRGNTLQDYATFIRSARKIVAAEFAGDAAKHKTLTSVALSGADIDDLVRVVESAELGVEPTDYEYYTCYDPHHSLLVTDRAGASRRIEICLECCQIGFPTVPYLFRLTHRARDRIADLFRNLKIPTRTSEEYSQLDLEVARASLKRRVQGRP